MVNKKIRVVDIPEEATAEETERLMNEPCEKGYYLFRLNSSTTPGVAMRAIYQLRAKAE